MKYVIPKFDGENFFLSNFHPSPIVIQPLDNMELTFWTGEHMFQALKWKAMTDTSDGANLAYVKAVCKNPNPNHAKKKGREVKIDTAKWEEIKIDMMRETVWEKFKQNPELRAKLMETGAAMLVEGNTWGDTFWGRVDGKGYNMLGSILMEVRGGFLYRDRSMKGAKYELDGPEAD